MILNPIPLEDAVMSRRLSPVLAFSCLALLVFAGCGGGGPSPEVQLGGIYLTDVLDGLMLRAGRTLSTINSIETAEAAAPELKIINDDFYDLRYHAVKLSEMGQREMAVYARKHYNQLRSMVDSVKGSPALDARIGGEMATMLGHLEALMAPPYGEPE